MGWRPREGGERRDEKEDLEVSDLPSNKPEGTYELKGMVFMRRETDRRRETVEYAKETKEQKSERDR